MATFLKTSGLFQPPPPVSDRVKKDDTLAFICKPILRGNNHSELHYYCMKKEQNWGQLKIFGFWD